MLRRLQLVSMQVSTEWHMLIAILTQPSMARLALCCKLSAINDSCCHLAECAVHDIHARYGGEQM